MGGSPEETLPQNPLASKKTEWKTELQIAVLLKQVPETEAFIRIANDGVSIITEDLQWVINPFDALAVEEALRIRDDHGGKVTIFSVGDKNNIKSLQTALAMGGDEGLLIIDETVRKSGSYDGLRIAKILAAAMKPIGFDLIIAGQRAIDDGNYLVGPAVAEYLGVPNISMAIKAEITKGHIRCLCTIEGGTVTLESPLPALFTTQRGINQPRSASLSGIFMARKKPLTIKSLKDIGLDEKKLAPSMTKIMKIYLTPKRSGIRVVEGASAQEKAARLVNALHQDSKVI
ncbi:MAG: electron transfer flavoprotein subunit beta/FixA family protein [Bacillota bacterium]|nr:electron transfer flavoprotein subunit beta/FixA family protein [Bacillota bacterium]